MNFGATGSTPGPTTELSSSTIIETGLLGRHQLHLPRFPYQHRRRDQRGSRRLKWFSHRNLGHLGHTSAQDSAPSPPPEIAGGDTNTLDKVLATSSRAEATEAPSRPFEVESSGVGYGGGGHQDLRKSLFSTAG